MPYCSTCASELIVTDIYCSNCGSKTISSSVNKGSLWQSVVSSIRPSLRKPLAILLAIGLPVCVIYSLPSSHSPISASNARDYLIDANSVAFLAQDIEVEKFSGMLSSDCILSGSINSGIEEAQTIGQGGISSAPNEMRTFNLRQRIITGDNWVLKNLESDFAAVPKEPTCSQSSQGFYTSYAFNYKGAQALREVFDVDLPGVVIGTHISICMASCTESAGRIVFAYQHGVGMLLRYSTVEGGFVSVEDMDLEVEKVLRRMAGLTG